MFLRTKLRKYKIIHMTWSLIDTSYFFGFMIKENLTLKYNGHINFTLSFLDKLAKYRWGYLYSFYLTYNDICVCACACAYSVTLIANYSICSTK